MEHVSIDGPATSPISPALGRLISPATAAAIHDALDAYCETGVRDSRLRPVAGMVCDDARASGLRVEQMLIALKTEWTAALENRRIPHGAARQDLTSRFITLCIYAYYAAQAPETQ
jgi:hypothetical protein